MEIKHTTSLRIHDIWFASTHCKYALLFSLKVTSDYSLCSFGNFPGVRSIKADVSEINVGSIVLGDQEQS